MPVQLSPVTIATPGAQGLLSQQSSSHLPPQWATYAANCVIDSAGRLSARKGWTALTSSAIVGTPTVEVVHEYIDAAGAKIIVSAADGELYDGTTTLTARTGALTPTNNNWKFQNFNNKCIAWQAGESPIVKTGAGNWAAISFDALSAGSHTWGNEVCAGYGRVWTTNSTGTVVKYSSLLDETDFASDQGNDSNTVGTTAGVIDLSTVWTAGMDSVQAIIAFNGYIIFFGKRQIVIYGDASGAGQLDPNSATFHLVEVIAGRGCAARDSVQPVGDDILYLSYEGVYSLSRVIQEKSNPQYDETINIRDSLIAYISGEAPALIKSAYSKVYGYYLISFPTYSTVLCMDMRGRSETGGRGCTMWSGFLAGGITTSEDGTVYLGQAGVVGEYSGYSDSGTTYYLTYYSGWFPLNEEMRVAVLKGVRLYCYTTGNVQVAAYWLWDYNEDEYSEALTFSGYAGAEYGVAEYSVSEYGVGGSLSPKTYMGRGYGAVIKIGIRVPVNGEFAIQQVRLTAKAGRI